MKHESFSNFFFSFIIPAHPIGWGRAAWLPRWGRLTSVGPPWPPSLRPGAADQFESESLQRCSGAAVQGAA